MKRKVINGQLYQYNTYVSYRERMYALATNVFKFENIPSNINMSLVNDSLLKNGSIAWFKDDVTGDLMCLPYTPIGELDFYGYPNAIKVMPYFGAYDRTLPKDQFVIMYDNEARIPLYRYIVEGAQRMALIKRAIDINISQQNTNRVWKVPEEKLLSVKRALEQVDSNVENILTYEGLDLNEISATLTIAPYVADKLNEAKHEEWAEFLEVIGVSNVKYEKKERMISDEVSISLGGTIASRYNRFESRKKAIEEINEKLKPTKKLSVEFYDGLPTSLKDNEEVETIESEEVVENV